MNQENVNNKSSQPQNANESIESSTANEENLFSASPKENENKTYENNEITLEHKISHLESLKTWYSLHIRLYAQLTDAFVLRMTVVKFYNFFNYNKIFNPFFSKMANHKSSPQEKFLGDHFHKY